MLTRQSALRVAAASVSAVVISMGAVAPVYAAGNGGNGKAHASQAHASAHQSQGRSSGHGKSEAAHAKKSSASTAGEEADGEEADGSEGESARRASSRSEAKATSKDEKRSQKQGAGTTESHRSSASAASSDKPAGPRAGSQGKGHTPVTVCHLLGNGGYHLLTFDQHALKAHLGHGDVYPDSTGACPSMPSGSTASTTKSHGHTPVTVCHLLGNGGYHLLTFDQHALKAHLGHGDVYPDSTGTCPVPESATGGTDTLTQETTTTTNTSTTTNTNTTETTTTSSSTSTEASEAASTLAAELSSVPTRVLGVQAARGPRVLGVEAFRAGTANTSAGAAPAQVAPAAGLLPNTGAARVGLPLVAGLGLLAAGAGLLLRRRGAARS